MGSSASLTSREMGDESREMGVRSKRLGKLKLLSLFPNHYSLFTIPDRLATIVTIAIPEICGIIRDGLVTSCIRTEELF